MYLVFIAMIAMTMSKEVLSAFGYTNEKLTENNITASLKNATVLDNLKTKAGEQSEKYGDLYTKAQQISELSNSFNEFVESKKELFVSGKDDPKDYESMDQSEVVDSHFFKGEGYTAEGQEFLDKINGYRDQVVGLLGEEHPLAANITKRFDTSAKKTEAGGNEEWLRNRYESFPLISTITNLTSMQMDIKTTESEIYNSLLGGQLESDVSMSNYKTILLPDKPAFIAGENFTGRIVLGRYDNTLKPSEVIVNGRNITKFEGGGAVLEFPAGNIGERDVKGKFVFIENGEPVEIEISSSYAVIPRPNSAVISADKMNVVYRGVSNPMTISIPGISDDKIVANATGLKKVGNSKYVMTPGQGREVTIKVSGTMQDGTPVSTSPKTFRIKDIPTPLGAVRKETGYVKMPKTTLERVTVSAELPDFDFDLKLNTTGFKIKVPGQSTVIVSGNKMNAQARKAIAKAKRGDIIGIFDIKSSLSGNSGYKIKDASAVSIEIQ